MKNDKAKKVKKKIKLKILPILMVIFISGLFYLLYLIFINVPIKNIYVSGNEILNDSQIIEIANLDSYPSFFKTSSKSIVSDLKNNPYIAKIIVKKKLWNEIYIKVEENFPLFINLNDKLVLSNGIEVEKKSIIYVPTLMNYVPDIKYEELIKKINKINRNIWIQVSEFKYEPTDQDKDRFGLYMNDGNLVYLTLTKFDKFNYYNRIINEFSCKKGILNLDSGNHFEVKNDECEN